MERLKRFGISIDAVLADSFDEHITREGYSNRSEALRDLIRNHLETDRLELDGAETVASLSLVYDHHQHELSDTLTHLQHDHHELIISTLHVHIDHDNCLEVIILKGPNTDIKAVSDRLMSIRGVKHAKLTMTATST